MTSKTVSYEYLKKSFLIVLIFNIFLQLDIVEDFFALEASHVQTSQAICGQKAYLLADNHQEDSKPAFVACGAMGLPFAPSQANSKAFTPCTLWTAFALSQYFSTKSIVFKTNLYVGLFSGLAPPLIFS